MWRTLLLTICVAAIGVGAGWARVQSGYAAIDPRNTPAGAPRRIVSLAPAITETCFALGLGDRVVARSSHCEWPPAARALPEVGSLLDVNIERLVGLSPDLILVAQSGRDLRGQLDAIGLPYVTLPNDSLDDVFAMIDRLGRLADATPAAEQLAATLRRRIDAIAARPRHAPPRRVLISISASRRPMSAPWVVGPRSYLGRLVERTGHHVVPGDLDRDYGEVSLEQIVRIDPEVIVEIRGLAGEAPDPAADVTAAWATLGPLSATRAGRVYILHGPRHVIPGPRCVDTLAELAELLDR